MEAWEQAQQVVDVHLRNQTCMASPEWHLYRLLHGCATWAFLLQKCPLTGVALQWQHHLTQRLLRCYFVIDSRLGPRAQVAQAHLEAASRQEQAVRLRWEGLLSCLLMFRLQVQTYHW